MPRGPRDAARSLLFQPGTVPIATTAATRPLSLNCRSLRRTLALKLPRAMTFTYLTNITLTPGDAAACSRMPTDISLAHSDLTHAVFLTHGRSLTRAVSRDWWSCDVHLISYAARVHLGT